MNNILLNVLWFAGIGLIGYAFYLHDPADAYMFVGIMLICHVILVIASERIQIKGGNTDERR